MLGDALCGVASADNDMPRVAERLTGVCLALAGAEGSTCGVEATADRAPDAENAGVGTVAADEAALVGVRILLPPLAVDAILAVDATVEGVTVKAGRPGVVDAAGVLVRDCVAAAAAEALFSMAIDRGVAATVERGVGTAVDATDTTEAGVTG
jgi:hypothetical protein